MNLGNCNSSIKNDHLEHLKYSLLNKRVTLPGFSVGPSLAIKALTKPVLVCAGVRIRGNVEYHLIRRVVRGCVRGEHQRQLEGRLLSKLYNKIMHRLGVRMSI